MLDFSSLNGCRYAVIGFPVSHSLSPVMHNAAFAACGIPVKYGKIAVPPEDVEAFSEYARFHLDGFNITVPDKGAVIPFLDEITPTAEVAHSVNTVKVIEGKLFGDSTDGFGLARALWEAFQLPIQGSRFCFVGAGGAVHAAASFFAAEGAAEIVVMNRTIATAEVLVKALSAFFPSLQAQALPLSGADEEVRRVVASCDVLIQATSLGLKDEDPSPLPATIVQYARRVFDTIYRDTAFQKIAVAADIPTATGEDMLLYQGARSFEIWTGRTAPVEIMRQALAAARS